MEAVCDLALAALSLEKPVVCEPFMLTVQLLHGMSCCWLSVRRLARQFTRPVNLIADIIFLLDDSGERLQDNIARVCEVWWKQELEGKEDLVINTICFLLIKSLSENSSGEYLCS